MKVSPHIKTTLFLFVAMAYCAEAQFFTKTANSIPRMGRRSEQMIPGLVKRVARTLRFVIEMVQEYDMDGNGELSPEELMDIPLIQNAVRSYLDDRDLKGLREEKSDLIPNQGLGRKEDLMRD